MVHHKAFVGVSLLATLPQALAVPMVSKPSTTFSSTPAFTNPAVPVTGVASHGPFSGTPTTTGAISTSVLAASVPALPPLPHKLAYQADGKLHAPQPAPYTPSGGLGTNGTEPVYRVQSDFDYQSLALALYQEYIELDLFNYGLVKYSEKDFKDYGLTAEDRHLLRFMAQQEVGHATVLTNMLGPEAPRQCTYNYPDSNLAEFIDFNQKLTRFGESGVYGFLPHLDSRESAQILLQSITTEARQQLIFRQFEGLFPMPVWFEVGVPQSWAWTLLAPYIASCPANQTRLIWQNFPQLHVLNQPNPKRTDGASVWKDVHSDYVGTLETAAIKDGEGCNDSTCGPAISHNRSIPLSYPGRQVFLEWDEPGKAVGPNNSYVTSTSAGDPKFVAWVSQLNVTYSPLMNVSGNSGYTIQPNTSTIEGDPAINGTMFLALTDKDLYVTSFNLTMINPHVKALTLYQAG